MNIVPFGKYKGQPVEAMAQDKQYVEWLQGQSWFLERYQNINTIIVNNFGEPSETPEHNKIQALFTDDDFCLKFIKHLLYKEYILYPNKCTLLYDYYKKDHRFHYPMPVSEERPHAFCKPDIEFSHCVFEHGGVDVIIKYSILMDELSYEPVDKDVYVEIKPSLSDDYPAVLRQMMANSSSILCIREFTATGATFDQVQKIFKSSRKYITVIPEKYF